MTMKVVQYENNNDYPMNVIIDGQQIYIEPHSVAMHNGAVVEGDLLMDSVGPKALTAVKEIKNFDGRIVTIKEPASPYKEKLNPMFKDMADPSTIGNMKTFTRPTQDDELIFMENGEKEIDTQQPAGLSESEKEVEVTPAEEALAQQPTVVPSEPAPTPDPELPAEPDSSTDDQAPISWTQFVEGDPQNVSKAEKAAAQKQARKARRARRATNN